MLDTSRKSQEAAEKEVERVREELAQASTAAITASHEASNLRQQLAVGFSIVNSTEKVIIKHIVIGGAKTVHYLHC